MSNCEHRVIFKEGSLWLCHRCKQSFQPLPAKSHSKVSQWLLVRRFRKQIEIMRIVEAD